MGHCVVAPRAPVSIVIILKNLVTLSLPVTVTWNGTLVTGPILIYHDEVRLDGIDNPMLGDVEGPGALVCRSQTRPRAGWRRTSGAFFDATDQGRLADINQIRNGRLDIPSFARLSRGTTTLPTDDFDGLMLCRADTRGDTPDVLVANYVFIGFYNRAPGKYETMSSECM